MSAEDLELFYDNLNFDLVDPLEDSGPSGTIKLKYVFPISTEMREKEEGHDEVEIIEEVARGGQKRVFKSRLLRDDSLLALAFNKESSNLNEVESFLREARVTKLLKHPAILQVHDYGIDGLYGPYMVMPWIEGETLHAILKNKRYGSADYVSRYPLHKLLQYFSIVCQAVSFAHSQDVIHLDLKPENILIDHPSDRALVADWGLAKTFSPLGDDEVDPLLLNSESEVGLLRGTPGYMSPEQIMENQLDIRTDVYQLGAILYSVIFLHCPIAGDNVQDILTKTLQGEVYVDSISDDTLPYIGICKRAMDVNPDNRYNDVREILNDLKKVNLSIISKQERKKKRHRLNLAVAVMLFLVTLLIVLLPLGTDGSSKLADSGLNTTEEEKGIQTGDIPNSMFGAGANSFLDLDDVEVPVYLMVDPEPGWYKFLEKSLNNEMRRNLGCSQESLTRYFEFLNSYKKEEL
jgi:serine/threonine protein kinase